MNLIDSQRVRVAVRVRPRNAEDLLSDADFADCVELQPEVIDYNIITKLFHEEAYVFIIKLEPLLFDSVHLYWIKNICEICIFIIYNINILSTHHQVGVTNVLPSLILTLLSMRAKTMGYHNNFIFFYFTM